MVLKGTGKESWVECCNCTQGSSVDSLCSINLEQAVGSFTGENHRYNEETSKRASMLLCCTTIRFQHPPPPACAAKDCFSWPSSLYSLLSYFHVITLVPGFLEGLPWRIAKSPKRGRSGNQDGCILAPPWNQNLTSQAAFLQWPLPFIIPLALNVPPAYVFVLERSRGEIKRWGKVAGVLLLPSVTLCVEVTASIILKKKKFFSFLFSQPEEKKSFTNWRFLKV